MRTFPKTSSMQLTLSDEPISLGDLAYERERLRNLVHEAVLKRFLEASKNSGVTRAAMARRLRKRPEQITRWLGAPGNWTIDTICDLMISMKIDPADLIDCHSDQPSNFAHELIDQFSAKDTIARLSKSEGVEGRIRGSVFEARNNSQKSNVTTSSISNRITRPEAGAVVGSQSSILGRQHNTSVVPSWK